MNRYMLDKQGVDEQKHPEYDQGRTLRKADFKGYISIQNHRYYLGETFIDQYPELLPLEDNCIAICYGSFIIARIDLEESLFTSRKIYRRCCEKVVYYLSSTVGAAPYSRATPKPSPPGVGFGVARDGSTRGLPVYQNR